MNEHMRVGHDYPTIRQALAYSFGLDCQDFVVAYETDDLVAFGDLVRALRAHGEPALDRQRHADPARHPSSDRRDPRASWGPRDGRASTSEPRSTRR